MGKSKSGGTRSYLRGRVGADVYSIGKDGKGKKQQVVRSLAEQVANPQTSEQMFGRMVMSTVMQAQSALSVLVNHSFDGVPTGQPSLSEFVRRNYDLIKQDAKAHAASGNSFGLVKYGEKGAKAGLYVISNGTVMKPQALTDESTAALAAMAIAKVAADDTAGEIRTLLGAAVGDYFTLVVIASDGTAQFIRAIVSGTLADETTITAENVAQLFDFEGTVTPTVALTDTAITISMPASVVPLSSGIIVSQKVSGSWKHNKATMVNRASSIAYTANAAFITYPQGSERFLNGGDL